MEYIFYENCQRIRAKGQWRVFIKWPLECKRKDQKYNDARLRGGKLRIILWEGKRRMGPGKMWIDFSLIEGAG